MSSGDYFQLYNISSDPADAFLLGEGTVHFYVSDADKYSIKGNNLIIGATEIILNNLSGMQCQRLETALIDSTSKIKKIPGDKFISSISSYSLIMNTSMVMAKQVLLTNQIINKNLGSLDGNEKKNRELAIEYFRILSVIKKEYDKRKYPWLGSIIHKFEASLLYKRGESFEKTSDPVKITSPVNLSDTTIEFSKDSLICEEGSIGNEMYILQSGTIDVLINNNRVASVSDPGYIFGEIAIILGEKRTATLKAKNNVVLTRLRRDHLKELSAQNSEVLLSLVSSLAKKHFNNIEKINSINNILIDRKLSTDEAKTTFNAQRANLELLELKKEVTSVYNSKDAEFLKNLVDNF